MIESFQGFTRVISSAELEYLVGGGEFGGGS